MADEGWFPDPTGRFGQRWYDGSQWTAHVVGASGGVLDDPMPGTAPPGGFPPGGGYRPDASAPAVRYGVGAGLVIGLVGIVLVALSLFAVPWGKGDKTRFTDFTSAAHKAQSSSFPDFGVHLNFVYVSWLAYVLLAAALVLTVLAGIPVPRTGPGNRFWRIGASLVAGVAGTIHAVTLTYTFTGSQQTAGFGALSGLAGYGLVMIAMIFGARRIVPGRGRP